ncbi:PEP-CTERM sorting domain-containing protein [Isosphaeraceae bacterium EP7]
MISAISSAFAAGLFLSAAPAGADQVLTDTATFTFIVGEGTAGVSGKDSLTAGHGDIGVAYEDGGLHLHYHIGKGATLGGSTVGASDGVERTPESVASVVNYQLKAGELSPSIRDYFGTSGAGSIYGVPISPAQGAPNLGFATEDLDNSIFTSGQWSLLGASGTGIDNGGQFALWTFGPGGARPLLASAAGVTPGNTFDEPAIGAHAHYYFGFSGAGVYNLTLRFTGTTNLPDPVTPAVPEPATLVMSGLGLAGVCFAGLRRKKTITVEA